jgi:biopolymer transport protein ExbD
MPGALFSTWGALPHRVGNFSCAELSVWRKEVRMAGISNDSEPRSRRSVDRAINMVPFIDLLLVTISFLLVTAVWTELARVEAQTRAPGNAPKDPRFTEERALHVDVTRDGRSVSLSWQRGSKVEDVAIVPLEDGHALVRELQKAAVSANGESAIVRVPAAMSTGEVIRLFDAVATPQIACASGSCPAFRPTLSAT